MPWIALLASSVSIGLVSSSARITSVKFSLNKVTQRVSDRHPDPKIEPEVYSGPIKIINISQPSSTFRNTEDSRRIDPQGRHPNDNPDIWGRARPLQCTVPIAGA